MAMVAPVYDEGRWGGGEDLNKTQVTRTTHTTHEPPHNRTHERNTRPNHLAAIGGWIIIETKPEGDLM